jgi:hypothetical protein
MDRSQARIDIHLRCPVTNEDFVFEAPRNSKWLARHWTKKTKIRCRACGSAHAYSFKGLFIDEVLASDQRLSEVATRV